MDKNAFEFCGKLIQIIGFYFPGVNAPVDNVFNLGCFGNFFQSPLTVRGYIFKTAEAAYQGFKFPPRIIKEFVNADTGDEAYFLSRNRYPVTQYNPVEAWCTMWEVLTAKFQQETLKKNLVDTGDSFLLEHGRETRWSNNGDGSGSNWLGLQLMILRDLFRPHAERFWFPKFKKMLDLNTGTFIDQGAKDWQKLVMDATQIVLSCLKETKCILVGCNQPKKVGFEFCSKTCFDLVCVRSGCNKPKWSGHDFCGKTCSTKR